MIELGNLVGYVFENLAKLIPGRTVHDQERGVRFTWGHARREQLEPGWWWFLPLRQSIEIYPVKDQVRDVAVQSLTTKDDVAVSASMCIEYEVFDAVLVYTEVHEFDESLTALAKIYLARAVRTRTYESVRQHQRRTELAIKTALSRDVERWGARIIKVGLESFVRARQVRLMGDAIKVSSPEK